MSTSNDTTVYIYVLQRISDKAYLYIGSAINPQCRFRAHKRKSTYPEIQKAFLNNDIRFLVLTSTTESNRIEIETRLWKQFVNAGHPIVNRDPSIAWTNHGKRIVSIETRQKISKAQKGIPKGPFTDEHKRKLSEAKKGKKRKPISNEQKKKLSAKHKGIRHTEETKRKMSESKKGKPAYNKGKPMSQEQKDKLSKTTKAWWARKHLSNQDD